MKSIFSSIYKFTAFFTFLALVAPVFALPKTNNTTAKALSQDQKILHVLNRLGFGARPGDVERVKQTGLDKYIEQQLNPASIPDAELNAKLKWNIRK